MKSSPRMILLLLVGFPLQLTLCSGSIIASKDIGKLDSNDAEALLTEGDAGYDSTSRRLEATPSANPSSAPSADPDQFGRSCGESAIPFLFGNTVTASTTGQPTILSKECGGAMSTRSAGLWYAIIGDGKTITIDTCSPVTNFDTQVSVWDGDCNSLTCVAGNDDGECAVHYLFSQVSFSSTIGETYYIYVSGFREAAGTFQMNVSRA